MSAVFNLLDERDRRILSVLSFLLVLSLVFLFGVALRQKISFARSAAALSREQGELRKIEAASREKEMEWLSWEQTQRDIEELKAKYFYGEEEGINKLRRDLQKILSESRMRTTDKKFDYSKAQKMKGMKIVEITFRTFSSYNDVKKFIHSVETFPKFLLLEKIDFLDLDSYSGGLKLNISLAGYYYEK